MKKFFAYILQLTAISFLVAIIVAGLLYAIIAEQEIRELKQTTGYRTWLHERALAEYYADKELHPALYVRKKR